MLDEYTLSGQDMVSILQSIDTIKQQADNTLRAIDAFKNNFEAVSAYCGNLEKSLQDFLHEAEAEAKKVDGQTDK